MEDIKKDLSDEKSQQQLAEIAMTAKAYYSFEAAFDLLGWKKGAASLAIENLTDQTLLERIAEKAKSLGARFLAAEKVTDHVKAQVLFAKLAKEQYDDRWAEVDWPRLAAERITDEELLRDVAMKAPSNRTRHTAVQRLSDQEFLAQIALIDKYGYEDICEAAIDRLTDDNILSTVAKTAKKSRFRFMAVNKIRSQTVLKKVVQTDPSFICDDSCVWDTALKRITDENLLAEILITHPERGSVDKIISDSLLVRIAKHGYHTVGVPAVYRIENDLVLADLALRAKFFEVREAAVAKVRDLDLVAEIARTAIDAGVGWLAVKRIVDQTVLGDVARTAALPEIRNAAISRVTDAELLRQVAKTDDNAAVCYAAIQNIADQADLTEIAITAHCPYSRAAAVERLKDQAVVTKVLFSDNEAVVRSAAVSILSDQDLLGVFAQDADWGVRLSAVKRLTNQALLEHIAETDTIPAVRQAAAKVLAEIVQRRKT